MHRFSLLAVALVAVLLIPEAAAAPVLTRTIEVRCKGSVSVAAVVRPGGRVLQVLEYTKPADGTKPQPTGRVWLSMTYRTQTLNRLCQPDPVLKRPQTAGFYGPYPPSNAGTIWCLVGPESGFSIQLAPIRNKKRAVVGTRMLVIQGIVGHKRAVAEARLTRTGGGLWFAPNGACLRSTG
jgi:hypothetical protein